MREPEGWHLGECDDEVCTCLPVLGVLANVKGRGGGGGRHGHGRLCAPKTVGPRPGTEEGVCFKQCHVAVSRPVAHERLVGAVGQKKCHSKHGGPRGTELERWLAAGKLRPPGLVDVTFSSRKRRSRLQSEREVTGGLPHADGAKGTELGDADAGWRAREEVSPRKGQN